MYAVSCPYKNLKIEIKREQNFGILITQREDIQLENIKLGQKRVLSLIIDMNRQKYKTPKITQLTTTADSSKENTETHQSKTKIDKEKYPIELIRNTEEGRASSKEESRTQHPSTEQ